MGAQETRIYRRRALANDPGGDYEDELVGAIDAFGVVFRLDPSMGSARRFPIGRVDDERRVFRTTKYADREIGSYTPEGQVRSHGLLEGGDLGWLERDGVVIQGGLILGEQEVGVVEGPNPQAGAAALLLILLPDDAEADKQAGR